MPPAAENKFCRVDAAEETTMTSPSNGGEEAPHKDSSSKDYYKAGSAEIVTETKLTVSRLEAVRFTFRVLVSEAISFLVGLRARLLMLLCVSLRFSCLSFFDSVESSPRPRIVS